MTKDMQCSSPSIWPLTSTKPSAVEEFDAMAAAYDAARQRLRTNRPTLTADQVQVLEKNLAQMILASACNGKRDVVRLTETALRGVSGRLLDRLVMLVPQLLPAALFSV